MLLNVNSYMMETCFLLSRMSSNAGAKEGLFHFPMHKGETTNLLTLGNKECILIRLLKSEISITHKRN